MMKKSELREIIKEVINEEVLTEEMRYPVEKLGDVIKKGDKVRSLSGKYKGVVVGFGGKDVKVKLSQDGPIQKKDDTKPFLPHAIKKI